MENVQNYVESLLKKKDFQMSFKFSIWGTLSSQHEKYKISI